MFQRCLLIVVLLLLALPGAAAAATPPTYAPHVYFEDPSGGLSNAIEVAGPAVNAVSPDDASHLVFNGSISDPERFAALVRQGKNAVVILGPGLSADTLSRFLGLPVNLQLQTEPVSVTAVGGTAQRLADGVAWNSAPQIRDRYEVRGLALEALVTAYGTGEIIIGEAPQTVLGPGSGRVLIVTPVLDGKANAALHEWAYANYLQYLLLGFPYSNDLLSFAEFPGSPVPHEGERLALLAILAAALLVSVGLFAVVRRHSLRHPEALDSLVAERERYVVRQERTEWDDVGFHRPLGGFLLAFLLGLVLFIPLIIYQNLILPAYVLPSAQALGIWGRVTQFFNVAWLFFDMGTSAAFIKFMAEYRVTDPRRGIMYGQLFVWWQMLSGALQVSLIVLLASSVVPSTGYAIYSWSIIVHALLQLPGFFLIYRHALMGLQRFDGAQIVDLAQTALPMIIQVPIVLFMVAWGRSNPVFGPAMGGLLGLGIASYVIDALCFGLGYLLYRRLGLRGRVLFMAHFDGKVIRSALKFGGFEMLGSMAWAAGQAAEVAITQDRLVNYAETWGNWVIAQNFIFAFNVINILFFNLVASISEAFSHGKRILSQYYASQAYRYGGLFSAFIGSVLLAVADRFIIGATGPEFARAALLAGPLIIWGAIQYASWVGDAVQLGCNRPYLKAILVAGEQVVRIVLLVLLLARFQVTALVIAYFVGLFAKGIVAFLINNRLCFPQRLYAWPSLVAPLLAGVAHYAILRGALGLLWQADQVTSVLIFFIAILPSYPLFAFLYGFFGGWDAPSLQELREGAALSGFMRPLARLFVAASAVGARLSPFKARAGIPLRDEANAEAQSLKALRVGLDG